MASLKDKMKDECGISAFSLALSIVSSNPELASKVCDLAEQAAEAGLRSDALKEGALQGVEGEVKGLAHDYTLKEQSADMKFKSVVFGGLFDKTAQGDEALRIISNEIVNTGGTISEGLELFKLIDNMDISSLTDVARVMADGDLETAKKIVDDIRTKLSYYIGTDYSVVTTGNPVKLAGVIKEYEKKIKEAQDKIDKALEKTGGKQLRHIDGDLEKVNNLKGTTVEGRKALAKIGREYGIEDGKRLKERLTKKLTDLKKAKDTLETARKEKKSLKAAKEYKDALAGDMKIIEDGGNPYNLIDGGEEWKYIKGFNAEPTKRAQQYGQYVLARALLTGGKDLPQEVIDVIKSSINGGVVNYLDEHLTEDWILDEDRTLDELLARAYTNTADLANNGQLRDIYRQRLMSLASDNEISLKDVNYVESLINTLSFAGAGSGFSDILKYENLTRAARNLGIDVPSSRGKDFYNSIVNLFKKDQKEFQKSIAGDFVKLGNGIELTNRQLLELVAEMLGNTNINKLIASDTLTDREILAVAGKYLIGDAVSGGNRLIELFSAAKNAPATNDTRGIVIKTITGQNVDKGAKVGFFDFRRGLKADPSVDMRAKFYDRLSSANTLELPTNSIEDITDNLERKISEFKGGYILVNDSQYKMSKRLTDAVDKFNQGVEKAEDKITIIYPTGGLMGTITSDGGKLIYRTSYTNAFNKLVRNISIRILGESDVDTRFTKELQEKLLGGDVDALAEYNKLLEEDAQKYFGEMLGVGEEAYKEKLQPMLEQATGISFKNYDAITDKTAFWKKVDENFILTTKVNGNMEQEFVTIGDVIKEVDSLTPEQMSSRLSDMYGLEVTAKHISKDGKQVDSEIRDAFLAYRLSETPIELLERKGKLLALLNGGTADNITVNQFKAILQSGDFSPYKDLFFHDLKLSDEELAKHAKSINDMVFNSLCAEAAMNLVKMGYSLPMVNIRDLVYDFLMDRLNVDGNFARAFLYKNGLPDTLEALRGVVNEIMPKDLRFGYDDGFKYDVTEYNRLGRAVKQGKTSRGTVYTVLDDGTIIEAGERVWGFTDDTMNLISSFLEVNTPSVVNGKTVKDLADAYHIPLSIAEDVWLANFGKRTLGRTNSTRGRINGKEFVQSMINLRRTVPKGTASHELFHAVFGTLSPTETQYFIDTAEKLYKLDPSLNHREANEMLADLFSEYFRTGSFTLPDTGKLQKNASFRAWILQWFQHISDWLFGINGYEKEVGKLFDDILSGKLKTTTKKAGYKNIDQWNNANISRRKNAMIAPRQSVPPHTPTTPASAKTTSAAQAKMILLLPEYLDDVINGKLTFNELKEKLGRDLPGFKSQFDALEESKVDLKNRTYDGLNYDEWRNRYFGRSRTGFNREAGNYDTIGRWQEGGFDPRLNSYVDILTDGTIFRDGYRWWGNKASWIDLVDSAIAVDTPSVVNGKTVKDLADEYGVPLFVGTDSRLDSLGAYGTLGRTNVENFVIDGQQVVQTMINLRRQIPKGTAPHELLHSIFLTMAPEDTKYFLDEAKRLYNYDERTANEMLADLFSEYFRTGSFSLPKQKAMFRKSAQEQKFVAWIKHFFGQMAAWLGLVDSYEKEITKLFDDILDGKIKTTKSGLTKEQLKNWNDAYVSGWKSRISFLHRNGLSAEGYTKFDGRVTPESIIAQFIVDTADDFTDDRYDHLIRTLLNTEENINLDADVPFSMSKSRDKFLLSYLYDLAEREREYYLEKIRNGEIIPGGATSRPGRSLKTLERFMEKLEGEIKKRPNAKETARVKQLYEEIKGLEGQDFNDVLDGITGHGFGIPVEIGIFVDKDGKIVSIGRGGTTTISPSKDVPGTDKFDTFYHSHPQVGRFSGFDGPKHKEKGDLVTFKAEPFKNVGLINPGGIVVTFKNTDKFRKAADSTINPLLQAITGGTDEYVSRRGTIQAGLITSLMTKEFDKQNWGIYDNIVQKYKNKVKHIVDKYDISDFSALLSGGYKIADADKNALETIGRLIKDEVKQYDLYYITHGPYVDWLDKKGLGDMFNYSNVEDTMGRYLTKGQEQFGFATVKDVKDILPKGVKLNFIGSKDSDIVRAYFGVGNRYEAGMGYDIYFEPSQIINNQPVVPYTRNNSKMSSKANACYIRFNPDNIVQDTDKLFSIMSREDMLLQTDWYNPIYKAIKNTREDITIKEFVDALEYGYPDVIAGDTLRRLFFDFVDGYYDKSKGALHLFYYNDVKDANNLNPKEVPNVYFDSGYNRPVGRYTDPATGIKYELSAKDYRELFDRGEEVITEFVPIEELDKLKDVDRRLVPKWSKEDSDKTIDELKEGFQKDGIFTPVQITYSVKDNRAYLGEGNHRLAAAKELGMKYLPTQVYVLKTTDAGQGLTMKRPAPFGVGNYYPDRMAPSEIGIKGTINSFDDRGYDEIGYGSPTYSNSAFDSDGRMITDQQDNFFEESQFRDEDGDILTLYRGATDGWEETDLGRNLRYRGDGHLKIFLTPSKDIVKYFGGVTKKRGTKLKDVTELEELLNRDETLHKYDINTNFVVRNLGNGQYEVVKQQEYFVTFDAPESYFNKKIRENGHEITRTKIGNEKMMDGGKGTRVREDEVMLKGTLRDIDKKLDRVLYPIDPVLAPYNPHYYEVYGLSRNPLVIDAGGAEWNSIEFNGTKMTTDDIADWAYDNGYDGAIFKNVKEQFYRDGKPLPGDFITDDYVVFSQGQLKSVDNLTPTEGEHWRDNTGYEAPSLVPDYKPRLVETKNQFTQDTYSSLIAMAAVKNGERIPSLGNEEQQLERILNDYYNAVAKATENGKTLSFAEAQKLKIKAGYALDMFEQDYVLPRYKNFLTPQERSELMGLKYGLAVGVNSDSLKTIKDYNDAVLNRYKSATQHIISQSDLFLSGFGDTDVSKEIEKRQEQLMRQGATLKEVDGQVIVVDTRDELFKELQHIPNNVLGLENLKALGRNGLTQLSNEQAYFLLNIVQLAKNMENKTNLIIQTIYKVSPQLARIDFFNTYRLEGGLPRILNNNTLSKSDFISKFNNTTDFDRETKKTILSMIKEKFARNGKLEYDELKEIINDSLTLNEKLLGNTIKGSDWKRLKKEASLLYTSAFQPYTYLKDVPKEVKISIGNILSEQQKGIRQALNAMGDTDKLAEVMDNIYIYAGDGTVKSFREAIDGEPADINKILFNADNEIIAGADDIVTTPTTSDMSNFKKKRIEKKNKKLTEGVVSNYEEGLRAYMNGSEMVSQAERDLLNTTLTAARQVAKKYTSTNTIAETDNALASINEEIIRRFKADILGLTGKFSKGGQRWDIGTRIQGGIMEKWERVQSRYAQYYSMSDDQLLQVKTNNPIDTMALNMAKYFKEIERRLGSMDGLTGVTTNIEINKAFGHLGQVVMNVKTINGLYSLMSGIEGNQILKFFRFSNPKQLSYVKEFVIGGEGKETVGGYRTYVDKMDEGLNRDWFNKTFATNFTQSEYRKIVQALTGFTIIDKKWKWVESALNFANSSNYLFRTLMSYPGQLITIANQSIAYFLKQKGWEESMGIEDLGTIDDIRKKTGILNGTYNEINWFNGYSPDDLDPTSFYNRYGIPDVDDVYKSQKFYSTDDIETIYAKIDEYSSSKNLMDKLNDWWAKILRNTDAYKDNANNIIDGIFARNFKNLAFTRALQSNNVMRFGTAEQFVKFMASDAPESMKKRLMETLASDSGKHFRNMLGLGFSGLDRAVSGGRILPAWASNILVGLTQLFNFRGAWGQNIARQTNNFFLTAMKMGKAGFSKEGRDAIALYLAKQPEFVNFASQLFNDLRNSRRLIRFQDNGRLPDEDNEYDWMDFIEYAADNMQFASQWWQGIQSYGTTRIATDWAESVLKSHAQPDIYKDTYGVGAFFNAMQKNFGRNWKVPAFAIKAIAQGTTNGEDAFWAYLGNEFWKLSFGTLRYMMNEDFTSYGYSTEMPRRKTGIPFVFTGEPDEGDKAFSYDLSNSETWENITNWYNAKQAGDSEAAGVYAMNLWDTAFNSSQLLGTVKGVGQVLNGSSIVPSTIKGLMDDMHFYKIVNPFDLAEAGDIIGETEAGAEIMKYGYYIPKKADDVKVFIDTIIGQAEFRPGNDSFNKSFFNFDNAGHMQNLEESNEKDAPMEMLLNNMKYLRDENRAFVLDENGNKIVTNYWEKHMDEIERKINDEDFLTKSNFNFIYNWVEANNTDPNYMLYKRLIGEGIAGNYIEQKANEYISDFDAINGYKKTEKMSLKNLKDSKYYDWFIAALTSSKLNNKGETVPFLEALATLDENALMEADVKIVEKQLARSGNQEAIKKFFSVNDKGEVNLTTKYESFLMEQGRLSNYLREGDLDSFLAETASITKVFKKDDPYGLMTATLLGSRVNMINSSDYLSSEQKANAINVLFKDNSEFIQTHIPEMISELGDKAEAYITQMNDSLYGSSIITDKLIADNEMNNSKSGRSAAKSASDKIKVIMADLAKAAGDNEAVGKKKYNYNFTPAKLNGSKLLDFVGGKGYTPTEPTVAIQKYTPHANFTLSKDVNRLVNGPKTQAVTKKKLLSKLESDTLKAFEAES